MLDFILNFTNKNDIAIYEKEVTSFKLNFDGSISNIKIFMDNIVQRANDTGWNKGQGDIIHIPVDDTPMNVIIHYGYVSTEQIRQYTIN